MATQRLALGALTALGALWLGLQDAPRQPQDPQGKTQAQSAPDEERKGNAKEDGGAKPPVGELAPSVVKALAWLAGSAPLSSGCQEAVQQR